MVKFTEIIEWLLGLLRETRRSLRPRPQVRKSDDDRFSSEKRRIAQGVRRFFEQNYELRYNMMKQTEEFRPRKKRPKSGNFRLKFFKIRQIFLENGIN